MSNNRYWNPNPLKKETGDCVVGAICVLTGKEWDEVYKELCDIGFELKSMPDCKEVYQTYLTRHGYVRVPISNKKGSKRPKVCDMARRSKTEGIMLCEVANHVVTVKDGYSWDVFDSSEYSLYCYWVEVKQ